MDNPQGRLGNEIRLSMGAISIFPDRKAVRRLIGMVLPGHLDERVVSRRHMSASSLIEPAPAVVSGLRDPKVVTPQRTAS